MPTKGDPVSHFIERTIYTLRIRIVRFFIFASEEPREIGVAISWGPSEAKRVNTPLLPRIKQSFFGACSVSRGEVLTPREV